MRDPQDKPWKLRLFASVDLVGSTAYKAARAPRHGSEWAIAFSEFFSGFPGSVAAQYAHPARPKYPQPSERDTPSELLQPWKFLGDEILFSVVLKQHEDVACHVWALQNAMSEFPKVWGKAGDPPPLGLKGTAWLAGFPVTNTTIRIVRPGEAPVPDYIGPSIDLGFRIAKFANETRLVLSADLALMLLEGADGLGWESHFYPVLHGKEVLKGVIGNQGYPIIYLHTRHGERTPEEALLRTEYHCDRTQLKVYLRSLINSPGSMLFRPFIENDPSGKYADIPVAMIEQRKELFSQLAGPDYQNQNDSPPPVEGPVKAPDPPAPPVKSAPPVRMDQVVTFDAR